MQRGIGSVLVATTLALVPVPARAGPPEPEVVETPPSDAPDPAIERARKLYDKGRAKFETFDYIGAIDLWTEAYEMLPDEERYADIRARLMFNLAAARLEAFDIDEKISHLRQAQRLMDIYVDSLGPGHEADAAEAEQWQQRIADRLEQAERSAALRRATPKKDVPPPVDPRAAKRARTLTIAGASVLAVGVAGLAAMGGGLGWGAKIESDARKDADAMPSPTAGSFEKVLARGHAANGLAIAGAAIGGAAVITGVVLLAASARTKPRAGQRVAWIPSRGLAWRF